jgi:hypothetical protein
LGKDFDYLALQLFDFVQDIQIGMRAALLVSCVGDTVAHCRGCLHNPSTFASLLFDLRKKAGRVSSPDWFDIDPERFEFAVKHYAVIDK